MPHKEEILHDLKKVKFIAGNGFDLYCGLKTSYLDFFTHYKLDYELIYRWIDEMAFRLDQNAQLKRNLWALYLPNKDVERADCWSAFFTMFMDRSRNYLWCDIEQEILDSLIEHDKDCENIYKPHWEDVWAIIEGKWGTHLKPGSFIMASIVLHRMKEKPKTRAQFYRFLLEELNLFELSFGVYITKQHIARNPFLWKFNDNYIKNAHFLLTYLCNAKEIVSIDCFNYGFTPESTFYEKTKFINGNCLNPIFGIDSVIEPDDPRYIFTKTNRRIEWDMNEVTGSDYPEFDNAIVFGHSLNKHDYSYFFPVLDQLEMTNYASKKRLVVAYSIYDLEMEAEIKQSVRHSIYSLFSAYAVYSGRGEKPTRLLDSLSTQGRVMTFGIPSVPPCRPFDENTDFMDKDQPKESIAAYWSEYLKYGKRNI